MDSWKLVMYGQVHELCHIRDATKAIQNQNQRTVQAHESLAQMRDEL